MNGENCQASEHITALLSGYASRYWSRKYLVILQCYVDDSSSDVGDRQFVLAGYFMPATQWAKFSNDWDCVLRASPSIEYLHMVEAAGLRGQFGGWSREQRDKKLLEFCRIIHKYQPWSIEVSVSEQEMDIYYKPNAGYTVQSPYSLCFYAIILGLYRHLAHVDELCPLDFIFDEQGGLGDSVAKWYYETIKVVPKEHRHLLGGPPIFRDDKKILPLQAADMLAWHLRREMETGGPESDLIANPFVRINGQHLIRRIEKDQLQKMAREMSKLPNIREVAKKSNWKKMKKEVHERLDQGLGPPPLSKKAQKLYSPVRSSLRGFWVRIFNRLQYFFQRFQ